MFPFTVCVLVSDDHLFLSSLAYGFLKRLLREACTNDEGLFSAFLNRLFNTLSWAMTEFSVSVREMQEKYQVRIVIVLSNSIQVYIVFQFPFVFF